MKDKQHITVQAKDNTNDIKYKHLYSFEDGWPQQVRFTEKRTKRGLALITLFFSKRFTTACRSSRD